MEDQRVIWRKSSRSGGSGGGCVEVATDNSRVMLRDSKDPAGGVLAVTPAEWRSFLRQVAG